MVAAELFEAVRRAPDATPPRLVLADALQTCGDPLGELIVVQHAIANGETGELRERAHELIASIEATIGLPAGARLDWRLGFVDALDLRHAAAARPGQWLEHRAFALLRALHPPDHAGTITLDRGVTGELRRWLDPFTPTLRTLGVGGAFLPLSKGALEVIADARGLEQLVVASSQPVSLSPLVGLPLRSLELRVRGLSIAPTLEALAKMSLSRLTLHLAGSKGSVDAIEPLLSGALLPELTHLGLLETRFAAAFVERLATNRVRTQLRSFVVTPPPVEILQQHRTALADLKVEAPDEVDHVAADIARLLALGLERHAEAIPFYDRAIASAPADTQLPWQRAISLRSAGRNEEAIAGWDAIIAKRPSAPALRNRHIALVALDRRVEARADLVHALTLRPEAVNIHREIGDIDLHFGQFESATARYRLALADQRSPRTLHHLALSLLYQRRDLDEARTVLDALAPDEDYGSLHVARGFAWLDADPNRAIEAFAAARNRCGGCDASCGELERATIGTALAYCELGDSSTALGMIADYVRNADCLAHLSAMKLTRALVLRLAGDESAAHEELVRMCPPVHEPEAIASRFANEHGSRVRIPGGDRPPFSWATDQAMSAVCALFAAALASEPLAPRVGSLLGWLVEQRPWGGQMWCEALPWLDRARRWIADPEAQVLMDVLGAVAWPEHPLFATHGLAAGSPAPG